MYLCIAIHSSFWYGRLKIDCYSTPGPRSLVDFIFQFMPKQYNHHRSVEPYILHTHTNIHHCMVSNKSCLANAFSTPIPFISFHTLASRALLQHTNHHKSFENPSRFIVIVIIVFNKTMCE